MVAKIPFPKNDPIIVWYEIFLQRRKYEPYADFYNSINPKIIEQYFLYMDCGGDPLAITPLQLINHTANAAEAVARKKTLKNLYSANENKKPYDILDDMRRNHKLLYCPTCGEDGSPGTLDHYLPKDVFPELSVCLVNLTPMCSRCQEEKSTDYRTENGGKMFFHPYFDSITECLFKVEFSPPFSAPTGFNVSIRKTVDKKNRELADSHLRGLDWVSRFKIYCEVKHLHLIRMMSDERKDEEPSSARKMVGKFLRSECCKSVNSWGAIYYKSVLECQELLNYLDHEDLPEFI